MKPAPQHNKRLPTPARSNAGFTLIEVLIALTIFAIGLLAVAGMQVTAIKGNSKAHSVSAKVSLGAGILEQIMALSGDEAPDENKIELDTDNDGATDTTIENFLTEARPDDPVNDPPVDWPVTYEVEGAGTCTATFVVEPDPTIGGTPYTDLTRITVNVLNPDSNIPVTQTIMKRRY
ncbi:MAG: prepilin-type N-terminal cleavage/methylation domain-containing protein [Desulfuromonadaceae bacterium]|nr:prepilin-type N-terminal cleavage/methylation domain-containing protein [Desulfuromonadaceae bacterium]